MTFSRKTSNFQRKRHRGSQRSRGSSSHVHEDHTGDTAGSNFGNRMQEPIKPR